MMNILDELFGGGRAQAGQDMYNQMQSGLGNYQNYYNQGLGMLNPYMQQGMDPSTLYNQFMKNYQMSGAAQAQLAQGEKGANQAAAASGMLGSGDAQKQAAGMAEAVRGQDVNDYLNRLYGTRQQGFQAAMGGANLEGQAGQGLLKYFEDMANSQGARDVGQSQGLSGALASGLGMLGHSMGGYGGMGQMGGLGGLLSMLGNFL
jgi:hypothetical protein